MLIHGKIIEDGPHIEVYNPYSGELVGIVRECRESDISEIISSASEGFEKMKKLSSGERAQILKKVSRKLLEQKKVFGKLLSQEVGKPIRDAEKEVERAANTLSISAEAAKQISGKVLSLDITECSDRIGFYQRVPVGIVLAITPFNFPLNLACHKLGPALAAGNSVILKPASKTPLTSMMLGKLFLECGLPKEALVVVCGSGKIFGNALVSAPQIRKISFTGSYEAGNIICKSAGVKKVTMELGSTGAVIVTPSINIAMTAKKICQAGFANAGQVCISVQRVYVHKSIKERLIQEMKDYTKGIICGDPENENTQLGPLISKEALRIAKIRITKSLEQGAIEIIGNISEGNILYPTILSEAPEYSPVIQEEMFAPVITVNEYEDLEEAIHLVNGTPYGLQAGIFTDKIEEAMNFAAKVECGGVMINDTCNYRVDHMPYGGVKNSGIGREGPEFAINEMTEIKLIVLNKN